MHTVYCLGLVFQLMAVPFFAISLISLVVLKYFKKKKKKKALGLSNPISIHQLVSKFQVNTTEAEPKQLKAECNANKIDIDFHVSK